MAGRRQGPLFPAYLRGIETLYLCAGSALYICFQPTYEGLKRIFGTPVVSAVLGFQPTYEGLKRWSAVPVQIPPVGFQPTYEGLKRGTEEHPIPRAEQVSSLPTRD